MVSNNNKGSVVEKVWQVFETWQVEPGRWHTIPSKMGKQQQRAQSVRNNNQNPEKVHVSGVNQNKRGKNNNGNQPHHQPGKWWGKGNVGKKCQQMLTVYA